MDIQPSCDRCKKELKEFGAILLSPPDSNNKATKFHICKSCHEEILYLAKIKGSTPKKKVLK